MAARFPNSLEDVRWASIVPLVGGMTIGASKALNSLPDVVYSYPDFAGNDSYLRKYMPSVSFKTIGSMHDPMPGHRRGLHAVFSLCPCAGLSMLSPFKRDDPRRAAKNAWMLATSEAVLRDVQPVLLAGENAQQLATGMGQGVRHAMRDLADKYGYTLVVTKTSSVLAGLPQKRDRAFYYFFRGKAPELAAVGTGNRAQSVLERLDEVRRTAGRQDDPTWQIKLTEDPLYIFLKERFQSRWRTAGGINEPVNDALQAVLRTGLMDEFCECFPLGVKPPGLYTHGQVQMVHRLRTKKAENEHLGVYAQPPILPRGDGWYPAVTAKTAERLVHPTEDRYLTYREVASGLMDLPMTFELPGLREWNVICQNVPVATAKHAVEITLPWMLKQKVGTRGHHVADLVRGRELPI